MKMKNKLWIYLLCIIGIIFIRSSCNHEDECVPNYNFKYETIKDIDGNPYKTITIGSQTWMAENLKVKRYRNGDSIPNIKDNIQWGELDTGAYIISSEHLQAYGNLYNWYAVHDSRNIAPIGWHVPTDAEWDILINYVGIKAAFDLRENCTNHWPCDNATNNTGFTALPSGFRDSTGYICVSGCYGGQWWSNTDNSNASAFSRCIDCYEVLKFSRHKRYGLSVRCIKDK